MNNPLRVGGGGGVGGDKRGAVVLWLRGSTAVKHRTKYKKKFIFFHIFIQKLVYFYMKQVLRRNKYYKLH